MSAAHMLRGLHQRHAYLKRLEPTAAVLLALLLSTVNQPVTSHRRLTSTAGSSRAAVLLTPAAARVARRFLAGYLAFIYGHASASWITDATPQLKRSLQTSPPVLTPAVRERHARILRLSGTPARAGRLGVSARINSGQLPDYTLGLLLGSEHHHLLVSATSAAGA